MVTVSFKSAEEVTAAVMYLAPEDRMRCTARQVEGGYEVDAPDELYQALNAEHPAPPLAVPRSVSSAQAKIALKRTGFLTAARSALEAMGDEEVSIWFTDARTWERNNPYISEVGKAISLSDAEIDDLFRQAAQIAA